jgi:Divergent InlB B-repeat domain
VRRTLFRTVACSLVVAAAAAVPSFARAATVPTTWCGNGLPPVGTDRKPDIAAGQELHVIYAHPSDAPDRIGTMANAIATDMATADAWWRRQDGTRTIRFDLFGFPTCPGLGRLDLADVALPNGSSFYSPLESRFQRLTSQLIGAPFNYSSRNKRYLVYFDGPAEQTNVCGQGGTAGGLGYAILFVQTCRQNVGDGGTAAITAVHEFIHSLGAVAPGAPHECAPPNDGHVCDNPLDILYWLNSGQQLDNELLDVGRDDYYGTGNSRDIRPSGFLVHLDAAQFPFALGIAGGAGAGSVSADLPGIECSESCTSTWEAGSTITLTETPAENMRFAGWSGACSGLSPVCTVTIDAAKNATATFAAPGATHVLRASVKGKGRVTSSPAGISCPGKCSGSFAAERTVRLAAKPSKGYKFTGWSGACKGRGACSLLLSGDSAVQATFKKK